jgi:hypothetical protein
LTKCQTCRFNRPRAISCPIVPAYKTCRRPLAEYLLLPHDNLPLMICRPVLMEQATSFIIPRVKQNSPQGGTECKLKPPTRV